MPCLVPQLFAELLCRCSSLCCSAAAPLLLCPAIGRGKGEVVRAASCEKLYALLLLPLCPHAQGTRTVLRRRASLRSCTKALLVSSIGRVRHKSCVACGTSQHQANIHAHTSYMHAHTCCLSTCVSTVFINMRINVLTDFGYAHGAETLFASGVAALPNNAKLHYNLGHVTCKDVSQALAVAQAQTPGAKAKRALKKWKRCRRLFQEAVRLAPDFQEVGCCVPIAELPCRVLRGVGRRGGQRD